jgi:hypothetical protein
MDWTRLKCMVSGRKRPHETTVVNPSPSPSLRGRGIGVAALAFLAVLTSAAVANAQPNSAPSRVVITPEHVLAINGRKVFPIGFTVPPAPGARTPWGKLALEEFRSAGALFNRTGPMWDYERDGATHWNEEWIAREREYMDAAARAGMYCMPYLKELASVEDGDASNERRLREVVAMFRDHPGMGVWKGADEPQWGKRAIGPLVRAHEILKEEDPNHPLWIVQAPRGTVVELKPYSATYDIGGVDVYPIGYPPGRHLVGPDENREISMIGDYAQKMRRVEEGRRPFWFTLQIAWSGVEGEGRTLRFPTYPEERFMTYQAIINGARGLVYFGGNLPVTLSERDRPYGWNWTFWQRVLRPVLEEVGDKSPLAEALCAAESKLPVTAEGNDIELCVREVGREVFVLACCRDSRKTAEVKFSGLPLDVGEGEVLYESPRKVKAAGGAFTDWFGPFEVHVYRFRRP